MLEAQKVPETISAKYVVPILDEQLHTFWYFFKDNEEGICCGKQTKAILLAVFLIIYGLIVLSFENERTQAGTTVVRGKIFGIELRYFLVYYNGLLAYLFMMYFVDETNTKENIAQSKI